MMYTITLITDTKVRRQQSTAAASALASVVAPAPTAH
jgi:hypothetical protein